VLYGVFVLTADRKHHQQRINRNRDWFERDHGNKTWGWPAPHIGKWWKRRLHKARRQWYKARLRGQRGKEPTGLESEVNWKSW